MEGLAFMGVQEMANAVFGKTKYLNLPSGLSSKDRDKIWVLVGEEGGGRLVEMTG